MVDIDAILARQKDRMERGQVVSGPVKTERQKINEAMSQSRYLNADEQASLRARADQLEQEDMAKRRAAHAEMVRSGYRMADDDDDDDKTLTESSVGISYVKKRWYDWGK